MSQDQLRAAHALIEQGRIDDARRLLQTLDDPTARLWLAQLNSAKRPQRRGSSIPLPVLIAVAVVIGIGALIVMLLLTPTLLTRIQNQGVSTSTPFADDKLTAILHDFCWQVFRARSSADPSRACADWQLLVADKYHDAAAACYRQSSDPAIFGGCLMTAGAPPPV